VLSQQVRPLQRPASKASSKLPRPARPPLNSQTSKASPKTPRPARPLQLLSQQGLYNARPARPLLNYPDQQGLFQTPRPARPPLNSQTSKASPKTPRPARPLQLLSQQGLYNARPARPLLNYPDQQCLWGHLPPRLRLLLVSS